MGDSGTSITANAITRLLDLAPLEGEGGFFRRTWTRQSTTGERPEATAIYYLVTPESFSAMHRLDHDEIFHFYLGDPCRQVIIEPDGSVREVILGHDIANGMAVQHVAPAGCWQGTQLLPGGTFALLGTTNSPGFDPAGFELATVEILSDIAPEWRDRVGELIATP